MQEIHGLTIYCDTEDYEIVPGLSAVTVLQKGMVIANFDTQEKAEDYVHRRTNPKEVPVKMYTDMCRCGWVREGWEYVSTEGIVFERCNKCLMPLRKNVADLIKTKSLEDFDLEDIFGD